MDPAFASTLDEALQLVEDAIGEATSAHAKVAEVEGQRIVGEKVLLEKVASLESRLKAVPVVDKTLVKEALARLAAVSTGDPAEFSKLASSLENDPNAALQLLVKIADTLPRVRAHHEGGGVDPSLAQAPRGADEW